MQDLLFGSAKKLAMTIRTKQVTAYEVAQTYLKQISRMNPQIKAIFQVNEERILQEAKAADEALQRGKNIGVLHGVPISLKDNIMVKGFATTTGNPVYEDNIAATDAPLVQRLKQAGAIVLGKTNLPDFASNWETESSLYGLCANPYNLKHTPGGSSGGEGAIIAAGGSALGIGNDGGGSIRVPAHYCGIAGMRPSVGLVPTSGHVPPKESSFATGIGSRWFVAGPMARYVEDLVYTLPIIAGGDGVDPNVLDFPLAPAKSAIRDLRVAYYLNDGINPVTADIEASVRNAALALQDAGAQITEAIPPGVVSSWDIAKILYSPDGGEGLRAWLQDLGVKKMPQGAEGYVKLLSAKAYSSSELSSTISAWNVFRSQVTSFMQDFDVIVCPVTPFTALPHGQYMADAERVNALNYLVGYSLLGWPSVVMRAGTDGQGLPIGVQIIARYWHDLTALKVAAHIEKTLGGYQQITGDRL